MRTHRKPRTPGTQSPELLTGGARIRPSNMAVALASSGGKATPKKMTAEERKEKMRRAAQAKWAKAKKKNQ